MRKRTVVIYSTGLTTGTDLRTTAPIGTITSANDTGTSALAIIRTDRMAAAEATGQAITANGVPVRIEKPDWLLAELAALSVDD